ncbi:MAG: polysaccharide biosynthesis protein GumN, partial [Mesorhizobium sp.]
ADTVVIETTEVLDQQKMMAAFLKEPELMMFTDSTTLSSLLSPDDAAAVNKALDARGIPPASVAKMKPWMLSTMVALPACELAR